MFLNKECVKKEYMNDVALWFSLIVAVLFTWQIHNLLFVSLSLLFLPMFLVADIIIFCLLWLLFGKALGVNDDI